jgi:hypothetical protein
MPAASQKMDAGNQRYLEQIPPAREGAEGHSSPTCISAVAVHFRVFPYDNAGCDGALCVCNVFCLTYQGWWLGGGGLALPQDGNYAPLVALCVLTYVPYPFLRATADNCCAINTTALAPLLLSLPGWVRPQIQLWVATLVFS